MFMNSSVNVLIPRAHPAWSHKSLHTNATYSVIHKMGPDPVIVEQVQRPYSSIFLLYSACVFCNCDY